ncbi:MAG: hypothetical protein H6706_15500 [Myxococcales bacterium]|nr:hypothetical protein [Myxococcales bacterium]
MGMFDWLFPSTEKKVARARGLVREGRFAEARLLLLDLDDDAARALLLECGQGLVRLNLEGALNWCRAGDEGQVDAHMERAEQFHPGGLDARIAEVRAQLEVIRRRRDHGKLWKDLEAAAQRRSRLGIDPTDPAWVAKNTGAIQLADAERDANGLPRLVFYPEPAIYEPAALKAPAGKTPTAAEIEAAVVALRAMYPGDLASGIEARHGEAALATIGGHPDRAVGLLLPHREGDAVAHFELGRAACALGAYEPADLAFELFMELAGGHRTVGELSSADIQAQVIAHLGEHRRALALVEAQRKKVPHQAPFLFAALSVEAGNLDAAAAVVAELRRNQARDPRLPPIVAALALRQTVAQLAETHPILRGVIPPDPEDEMAQRSAVADALGAAIEKAMRGLEG